MLPNLYSHVLNGFLLSLVLIVAIRPVARDFRLVDTPDARKWHNGEIPLCGGLAIFPAFVLSGFGFDEAYLLPWNWGIGFLCLILIGLADDRWHLSPAPRLAVQFVAAAILSAGGATLLIVGAGPDTAWQLHAPLATIFSIVFIVGMANAVNMLDGADGLAGATVAAALFWLAVIGAHVGDALLALQALVLMAAVIGFLAFNMRHPWRSAASIFLGDAGSMILGGALATFILHLASADRPVQTVSFAALLWLVIVPICDTLSLMVRRAAVSRSPFSSDRWHLHHLLLDCGVPPAAVAPLIAGMSAACGAVAYCGIAYQVPGLYMAMGLVIPVTAHTMFVVAMLRRPVAATQVASSGRDQRNFNGQPLTARTNEAAG